MRWNLGKAPCCLAVLSDRNLYLFAMERRGILQQRLEVADEVTVPLSRISATSKAVRRSWLLAPIWELKIWWEGRTEHLMSRFGGAEAFRDALDEARFRAEKRPAGKGVSEELAGLLQLRECGALTEEEWERAKCLFLGAPVDKTAKATETLRKLYELSREGVLSNGEFNMKKWDILSRPGV
jgi:hypothetical protein